MSAQKTLTAPDITALKGQRKIAMITAYDYPSARFVEQSGAEMILVGDSLAMVVLGLEDTISLTMDEMIHHCKAVTRAADKILVVGDMPFLSYEASVEQAVRNAGRLFKEGGVRAVKLEGGEAVLDRIQAIVRAGIPVQGHIGLTPQRMAELGGFKVQGKTREAAQKLIESAQALVEAGCFSIVLEAIPAPVAALITESVSVPTIGIGAGPECDGQVLVYHDILGMFERFVPKFVKQYAKLSEPIVQALSTYCQEVRDGNFPDAAHSFKMPGEK